jgi:hypothetical protein
MRALVVIILLALSASAQAYIGPGAGLSVLGSLWTVLVAIALALFAVLTWPVRILWRKLRGKQPVRTHRESKVADNDPR